MVIQFDLQESFFYICCESFNLWVLNFNRIPVRYSIRFGAVCRLPFRLTSAFDDNLADTLQTTHLLLVAQSVMKRKVALQDAFVKIEVSHFFYECAINLLKELVVVFVNKSWI